MFHKIAILAFPLAVAIGSWAHAAEQDGVQNGQVEIKPGDIVEVASDRAKFKLGRKVVATLEKGSELEVKWVEDGWIGGRLSIGGAERIGWIRREDVKKIKSAPPKKTAPAPPVLTRRPATKENPATRLRPPVAKQPAAKEPTVKKPGFSRVVSNALARNENFTIEVLMARNARDLAEIKPSEKIGTLALIGKGVTNQTLKSLKGLDVRMLNIDGARITNSGLVYLEDIRDLRVLRLWSADLTDAALARVKNLTSLEALDLEGANVRGTGLRYLKSLENLHALVLGPGIQDAELEHLGDLVHLEELDLRSCRQITDAGLAHLGNSKNLQRVKFPPQITHEATQSLGQKLPKCEFFR